MYRRIFPTFVLLGSLWAGCAGPTALPATVVAGKATSEVRDALSSSRTVSVIVMLKEPEGKASAMSSGEVAAAQRGVLAALATADFRLSRQYEFIPALAGEVTPEGLSILESLPEVLHVGLDRKKRAFLSESSALIGSRDFHSSGYRGSGAVVAVLDSGVDRNHPDLRSRMSGTEACMVSCPNGTNSQTGAGSAADDDGHGTHVAGIVASQGVAAPLGIAPSATIVAVRVLGRDGGSDAGILAGLDFVSKFKIHVVNMSLGGGKHAGYCDAQEPAYASIINRLVASGTFVVVASGNDGYGDAISSPACLSQAVSVGAVYAASSDVPDRSCGDTSTSADRVTCFSNSYKLLDLLAPGGSITSSAPGGRTFTGDGTSQATPHVAGAAALLMGAIPSITPAQVYAVLVSTGKRVTDAGNGVTTPRIDLRAALKALR